MAQLEPEDLLRKAISGENPIGDTIRALVDRDKARMRIEEGRLVDFKLAIDLAQPSGVGELAKDILGFSNANGGILLFGVSDDGSLRGSPLLDGEKIRLLVGPYIGTRILYEVGQTALNINGVDRLLPFIMVRRTTAAYPGLLRHDVETRRGILQKVRVLKGSLPYRVGAETKVEPPGEGIAEVAHGLNFTFVAPRTRSSFVVVEDRPGIRLYDHINDRFFGREEERKTLLMQFEDPRGRGVSIGGLGGIGKTELAINLVSELHRQRRFSRIYSGSAKTLLAPLGSQQADPKFHDYPTFLQDLSGWLGTESSARDVQAIEVVCIEKLREGKQRVLLFVDNLETVEDARLFQFLDTKLPPNVWVLATSRVHRIRNFIYLYELQEMARRDAARLLRHELKRQGLDDLADTDIGQLEAAADRLLSHPLAIRWYAWLCKKDRAHWESGPDSLPKNELEAFCVAHTLANLSESAVDTLAAIAVCQDQVDVDTSCIIAVSGKRPETADAALYELEGTGLITVVTDPSTGRSTYGVVQLAISPIRDLIRKRGMEAELAARLKGHTYKPSLKDVEPIVRYLVDIDPGVVRRMDREEINELLQRIERAKKSAGAFEVELLHLQAECQRQVGNIITADDLYKAAAERTVASPALARNERAQQILLEAATVAKQRWGLVQPHLVRLAEYLEKLPDHHLAPLRIPGILCEVYAALKNQERYEHYRGIVQDRLNDGTFPDRQREQAEAALARAEQSLRSRK